MKKIYSLAMAVLVLSACKKENAPRPQIPVDQPVMQYLNLQEAPVPFGQRKRIDINSDGTDDFMFTTYLVGDPILKRDRRQYYILSGTESRLLNDFNDQSPVLNKGDQVMLQHPAHLWLEVSAILLTEKIVPETGASFWQGLWTNANHKYLPVQVKKNGNIYNGWIEISFDMVLEKLILHKAAVSTEPGKTVKAGY